MKLSELQTGEKGYISKVSGRGAFRRRITEMGFVRGKQIQVIKNAPLKDPVEYHILGYSLSLRKSEADLIEVTKEKLPEKESAQFNGIGPVSNPDVVKQYKEKGKVVNIALVGNPNAGKTSIFNLASNTNERTGNYSGVTIDSKTSRVKYDGYLLQITDLPGTYSISALTPEELYVRDYIIQEMPDVVVNVIDASNLERNLYLTTQLIDMDVKVVLALNMYDELERRQDQLDFIMLGKLLGIPIVPTVGSKGRGVNELFQKIISLYNDVEPSYRHVHINYGFEVEKSISRIQERIKTPDNYSITDFVSSRYVAIKLLEKDRHVEQRIQSAPNYHDILISGKKEVNRLEELYSEDAQTLITDSKYGFIGGALKETFTPGIQKKREITEVIDSFLTHRLFGFPFFIFFLWLMFTSTFVLGEYPMQWIEGGVGWLGKMTDTYMAEGSLKDLLTNGIIDGVGGVIVFLPNILILFLFISFMEDSGYMARAVFITDKLMHRIGLHGRSFIPLIMGFGCNVPAIMATRTIQDRNDRLLTMLINPFMSCSARLPVYLLLIGAIFPKHRGTVLFAVYLAGILLAVIMALVFKKTLFRTKSAPFVMELPPYRMPTFRSSIKHMWHKASQYLKKMGGIILVASVIMWALGYFPRDIEVSQELTNQKNLLEAQLVNSSEGNQESVLHEIEKVHLSMEAERLEKSYIGRIGKGIEPLISPCGFDWKMGISLLSGIAAKEIVVSTIGVLYHTEDGTSGQTEELSERLRIQKYEEGKRKGEYVFTPLTTISFMAFILIYFPCIAVVVAIRRESGSRWWALFSVFYTTLLAWIVSFAIFQIGSQFI